MSRTAALVSFCSLSVCLWLACEPPEESGAREEATQSSTFSGSYLLQAVHSGRCADVSGGSTVDGTAIVQQTCDTRASERWQLRDLGAETYEIRSVGGKCLDVAGNSQSDGARVIQWTCKQSNNQKFTLTSAGGGAFNLRAVHSGKCLEVAGSSTSSGAIIDQWTCGTGNNQKWQVLPQNNAKLVVLAGAVTASADDGNGNVAANVVDGSLATRWSASGDGQWIRFDLGASRRLAFVKLAPFSGTNRSFKFDVQTSLDGATWRNAATNLTTPLSDSLGAFDFADVDPVRFVRILGHANTASAWNSYTEIELYGAVSSASGCVPESDATLCGRLAKNCGSVSGTDNCGAARTVSSCGTCTSPQTCGGGGVANVCGGASCTPETSAAFCSRLGKNCGSVSGTDNCGAARTVSSCGTCTSPQTCGGGGVANVCGSSCIRETDAAFCGRLGKNCGPVTGADNCGVTRTVISCGSCTSPQTCGGAGVANLCGAPAGEPPLPACKRNVPVASSGALGTAVANAIAGDCIVLADGDYTFPTIRARGTSTSPIVIKAANLLKATGSTGQLVYDGAAHVVVQGLHWRGGSIKMNNCDHCRLSRSRLQLTDSGAEMDWVIVGGTSKNCRIDHNDFGPKNVLGNMVMLSGSGSQIVQYTRIDHNFFHDVLGGGGNGWETIRAGLSGWTFSSAGTVIERNLFLRTTGDPETISIKSSDNIIRFNTMRASRGEFTLRHGNRNTVHGNFILGDGASTGSAIRVLGGDHKLYNNYIQGVAGAGIFLEGGSSTDTTGMLTDHKQVYRTQVVFNTIVSSRGIVIGGAHPIPPENCTVAYNVLQGTGGTMISEVAGTLNTRYLGNIIHNGSTAIRGTDAIRLVDPRLVKVGEIFKLGTGSPAIDRADSSFTFVVDDFEGQRRSTPDVGADEVSSAAVTAGLLGESDVGPASP